MTLRHKGEAQMEPLVRGRHVQEWLERIEREPEPFRSRFFEALSPTTRQEIDSAPRLGWVPARLHVELSDVLIGAFGPKHAHDYYRRAFSDALRGPIFDTIVKAGMRILGVTPGALLRWAHKGWEASFRHCGRVEGHVLEPGRGELLYIDLPPVMTASDPWLDSAQGSAYGAIDVCSTDGVVRIDKTERDRGRMRLELQWSER